MTIDQLDHYLAGIPASINADIPDIIAETAVEYYKEAFTLKEFDNNPWQRATVAKNRGSLLIDSAAMLNSIQPAIVTKDLVVISAGNSHVNYAQAHNEGFVGNVTVPAHTRKGHQVKSHTRQMNMPQRQFLGKSGELITNIMHRIDAYIKSIT